MARTGKAAHATALILTSSILMVLIGPPAGADPRTETRSYTGGTAAAYSSCDESGDGVSLTCFPLLGDETSVQATINDETGLVIRGEWQFRRALGTAPRTFFCGSVTLDVPEDAIEFRVYIHMLTNTASCTTVAPRAVGGPATYGTVTATFDSE